MAATSDKFLLEYISRVKQHIREREVDSSRAKIEDLYAHGRLQGSLDGLEEALAVLDEVLTSSEDNN